MRSAAAAAGAAFLCTTNRGKLLQHKLIRVQCIKKSVPLVSRTGYRYIIFKYLDLLILVVYYYPAVLAIYSKY